MKFAFDIRRFAFYLWVGLGFLSLWLVHDFVTHPADFLYWALNELWRIIYLIIINLIFFEFVLPHLVFSGEKIILSLFAIAAIIFLFSLGLYAWRELGIVMHVWTPYTTYKTVANAISHQYSSVVSSIGFVGVIRHIYGHIKLRQTTQLLQIEKQQAELNYLKSQTNPHFLFNTLNNIYSLARDKSDLAAESILRLSQILRFMLYETGGKYISIEQELKIITDYIALEKLRYDDSLKVTVNYKIDDMKLQLPPLLLISLVENAFKHGVSETRHQPFVDIHVVANNQRLDFTVKNSSEKLSTDDTVKENIGLSNLRRQLELLYTDYKLTVQQDNAVFTARLIINLASHA